MRVRNIVPLSLVALAAVACDRKAAPLGDSATPRVDADADARWVPELGGVLAIPGDSDRTAIVLFPAEPADSQTAVSLMRTAGDSTMRAQITPGDSQVCGDAAAAQLSVAGPSGWTLGFAPTVSPLPLDSIESATVGDSSALAADVARLASAVPNDRESRFTGLPFAVLAAHRLTLAGRSAVVARVARRIPQEAAPMEERTLVVGERSGAGPFALKYSLRSAGGEDSVEHHLLLGAVRAGDKVFVIVEVERENASRYEILERASNGVWQLRWTRTLSC